jgi:hypothetical protein
LTGPLTAPPLLCCLLFNRAVAWVDLNKLSADPPRRLWLGLAMADSLWDRLFYWLRRFQKSTI